MKQIVNSLLRRLGFIHIRSITEDDIWRLTSDVLSESFSDSYDKGERDKMLNKLRDVEGYKEYLTYLAVSDIRRFFQASTPQQQLEARGAYARAVYFKSLLVPPEQKQTSAKLSSKRHG